MKSKYSARPALLLAATTLASVFSTTLPASAAGPALTPDAAALLRAPLQPAGKLYASTDAKHQNNDYLVLKAGETRRIPLGAGILKRLWVTALEPGKVDLFLQNGAKSPLLRDGKASQGEFFQKAFTFYPETKTPAPLVRLNKDAALIVTNHHKGENKFFYQAYVVPSESLGPTYLTFDNKSFVLSTRQVTIGGGNSCSPIIVKAGGKSGVISELRIQASPINLDSWSKIFLRVDRLKITRRDKDIISSMAEGQSRIVYAPLSALAGQFYDLKPVENAMTKFDGKTLTLRWPMPFNAAKDNLQISLENKGSKAIQVLMDATVVTTNSPSPYLFCAMAGSSLTEKGKPLSLLKATGDGLLAGLNFAIAPSATSSRRAFAYLEGNETITADGRSYEGTGTEDFFNSAWYFPKESFNMPYHGLTFKSELPPRVSAYRLMVRDALPFKKSLSFLQEVGRNNNADDLNYSWVAFWYQKAPAQYEIADKLQVASAPPSDSSQPVSGSSSSALIWMALIVAAIVGFGWSLTRKKRP